MNPLGRIRNDFGICSLGNKPFGQEQTKPATSMCGRGAWRFGSNQELQFFL
jgi:hypothetical protein